MTDKAQDQGQDVFGDSDATAGASAGEMAFTSEDGKGGKADVEVDQTADVKDQGEDKGQTGDDKAAPPAADKDEELETVVDAKGQKMIPEHRFKAALKKVTDELDDTKGKLSKFENPEVKAPDKDVDPEGHDLHVRMEASTSVMREMKTDYQNVINHYATLAKDNPLLNEAVSKHPLPAKLAYDIAKRDLDIKEALDFRNSEDFKEFQEWKKSKPPVDDKKAETENLNNVVNRGLKAVPNLNRSTNASPNRNVRKVSNGDNDDELFKGAL